MIGEQTQQSSGKSARRTREVARRLNKLTEAQAAMGWGVILLLIMVLGAIYLNQSSKTAAVGRSVQQLDATLGEIQRVNASIERDIAEAQSLDRLQAEATRMGFVPAQSTDIEYRVIENYPALGQDTPELPNPVEMRPRVPETMQDALLIVVEEQMGTLMRGEAGE